MPSNVSQLTVFFQAVLIIIISCVFLKIIDGQGQEWPIVIDPFPDPDIIGPEPPPTPPPVPDCTFACQEKIDEAMNYITSLQQQLGETNSSLFLRIINLEQNNGGGGGNNGEFMQRLTDLERRLAANVTMLLNKIDNDVINLQNLLSEDIAALRAELETKINNLPSGGGGDGGAKVMEVYLNLTNRINLLENGKIQNLISDSNLWRQNFRVVNATFAKLRKSSNGNNVILTG